MTAILDPPELHVVAGVIEDGAGRVLLAQRGALGEHAGLWEFPGGKVESGEDAATALRRELLEELGIEVVPGRRVHRVRWREADRMLVLDGWRARVVRGVPEGRQGQALQWVDIANLHGIAMPPADAPLRSALRLAEAMWITPGIASMEQLPGWSDALDARLDAGVRLVQLRLPGAQDDLLELAADHVRRRCGSIGARWILNGDANAASRLGAHGVHLSSSALRECARRPGTARMLVGASCHDGAELARAAALALDYATLSPLRHTPSHPSATPLGDARFAALVRDCPLPVFALGGVGRADVDQVRAIGAFGVAGIRGI